MKEGFSRKCAWLVAFTKSCEEWSQILHKIISTHLLTVLIMRVIVHTEQRKREKRNLPEKVLTELADVFRNSKLKTPAQHAANIDQEE